MSFGVVVESKSFLLWSPYVYFLPHSHCDGGFEIDIFLFFFPNKKREKWIMIFRPFKTTHYVWMLSVSKL